LKEEEADIILEFNSLASELDHPRIPKDAGAFVIINDKIYIIINDKIVNNIYFII